MSTLDKMSIRGVRSFGTSGRDEQKITFSAPLTLILGENGCGKTTIIECLKYALTGELPPGSNKGQSFVHDPKIFNVSECLGQVRLQVRNGIGDKITVVRSMKTSVAKRGAAGLKFETLDSTINIELDGKQESISKRCADTNAEMAHVMGVSKAIINNVLFCHQEESSWPLDEGKKLKERFDAIFGTSEYNKAIEKILKFRKTYEAKAKEKEGELKLLIHLKNDAESRGVELVAAEEKVVKLDESLVKCEDDMKPIRDRLNRIRSIELEISKLYTQKTELLTKVEKCKEHQTSLTSKIRTPFEGTLAQIDRELRTFKDRQAEKKTDLRQFNEDLVQIQAHERRIQAQLSEMERKRSTLILQRQQEQDFNDERAKHVLTLCQQLEIADVPEDLNNCSSDTIESVMHKTRNAFKQVDSTIAEMARSHDREEGAIQLKIDNLREQRAKVESDITSANKQAAELRQEQGKAQQNIEMVEKSARTLKMLSHEIAKVDKCYEDFTRDRNPEAERKKIEEHQVEINAKQEQLDKIDAEVTFLNSIAKASSELSHKQRTFEQREVDARKIRNKHSDNLKQLLQQQTVDSQFKRRIQTVYQNLQREIGDLNKQISKAQQKTTEYEITRKNQKAELVRMERELSDGEERIYEHCRSAPYAEVLDRVKLAVSKNQLDHGALKASEVLYKKYMQKMEAEPCCPLCHKDMSGTEVGDLTTELQDEIRQLPQRIEGTERTLKSEQRKYEALLGLKSITERVDKLKIDIPKLKESLTKTENELEDARTNADCLQMALAEPQANMELAQSMLGDMSLLDEAMKDTERLDQELKALQAKMPTRTSELTMEDAQKQRETLNIKLREERRTIEQLRKKHQEFTEMANSLREKRNQLKDQQIKLQEGVQALDQIKKRLAEIQAQIEAKRVFVTEQQTILGPLKESFRVAEETKIQKREDNRLAMAVASSRVSEARRVERDVMRCSNELKKLSELNLDAEFERLRGATKLCMDDQKERTAEAQKLSQQIDQLRQDVAGQEVIERDLQDNRELIMLKTEVEDLQQQLDVLTKDMTDHDFKSVTREKEELVRKSDAIQMERSKCIGQMGELQSRVTSLKQELGQPKYQDSVKNYRQTYYDSVVLRKIVGDLGTYRVALEWALMKYHAEKMEKVNQLIKGLWHSIYRGNDIDYIQIRTDEMKTQNADKKRSYDYRVVQIKNDSELDMRGRCSAGQRVLACLIIRIALAETFSSNCGVLALDEPTTNLDRVNIVSLCEALNKIVEERQSQSSFMLVIITHDEEFITTLGRIEHYWKVSRGSTGKSIIQKVNVE